MAILALVGCGFDADPYDRAMKRLVAEQKQLDWIEKKIDGINEDAEQQCEELEKSARDVVDSAARVSPEMYDKAGQSYTEMMKVCDQIRQRAYERAEPLREQRAEQLKRVQAARDAADEASK